MSALSEVLNRDEDAKDVLIRQQQTEIARLRAENEALRVRLKAAGLDGTLRGVRRVSSGVARRKRVEQRRPDAWGIGRRVRAAYTRWADLEKRFLFQSKKGESPKKWKLRGNNGYHSQPPQLRPIA